MFCGSPFWGKNSEGLWQVTVADGSVDGVLIDFYDFLLSARGGTPTAAREPWALTLLALASLTLLGRRCASRG